MTDQEIRMGDRVRRRRTFHQSAVGTVTNLRNTGFGLQATVTWDEGYGTNRISNLLVKNLERIP